MNSSYMKYALWDFLLVALAACALTYSLLDGFYVDEGLQYGPLPAVGVIVCLVILYVVAADKRRMLIGGIAYAAILVVVWLVSIAMTPDGQIFVDNQENYLIFAMVITLTATVSFLVTRNLVGTALFFIVGAFLSGFIELFYQRQEVVCTVLFVFATLALLVYKNYQKSMLSSMSLNKVTFLPGIGVAFVSTLVAVLLGVGLWFGVIAPLNPQAAQIKLITEYRALETLQVHGTSMEYQRPLTDMTSDQTNNDSRTTDDIVESQNGTRWPATGDTEQDPNDGEQNSAFMGLNLDSIVDAFNTQGNPAAWLLLFLPLLIVALIVGYFLWRRANRKKRLEKFAALGPDEEFKAVFLFLLEKLKRIGISVPNGQTMLEFGTSSENAVYRFDVESGVSMKSLAACYSETAYGKKSVEEGDVKAVEAYYNAFWKACRKQLGNLKYFFKAFVLG